MNNTGTLVHHHTDFLPKLQVSVFWRRISWWKTTRTDHELSQTPEYYSIISNRFQLTIREIKMVSIRPDPKTKKGYPARQWVSISLESIQAGGYLLGMPLRGAQQWLRVCVTSLTTKLFSVYKNPLKGLNKQASYSEILPCWASVGPGICIFPTVIKIKYGKYFKIEGS